jgi:type I restriction enzyme S subunit
MRDQVQPFFMDGPASDATYVNTRDHPSCAASKAFVESLWKRYCPYADSKFRTNAPHQFHQHFWEMYLGVTLLDKGYQLTKHGDAGPEFSAMLDGKRVWFEAIAPTGGTGPNQVSEPVSGKCRRVPTENILLRFTNALDEKKKCYMAAVAKGIIAPEDLYILAINSRRIPSAWNEHELPYFVQAFLAFGPLTVSIDPETSEVTDTYHRYQPQITKVSGVNISTRTFLDQEAGFCSAIIHSAVDCANYPTNLGTDFSVLYNPNAKAQIRETAFPWCTQFAVRDEELHRSEPIDPSLIDDKPRSDS